MVLSTSRMASKKGLINSAFIGGPCAISRPVYRLHETKIQLFRLRTGNEFSPCSRGRIAILPLENPPSPRPGGKPRGERREGSSRLKQGNATLHRRTHNHTNQKATTRTHDQKNEVSQRLVRAIRSRSRCLSSGIRPSA